MTKAGAAASSIKLKLLLVVASTAIAVLLGELILAGSGRITPFPDHYVGEYESRPSPNFVDDPQLGWKMRPGTRFDWFTSDYNITITANAEGFRGPEFDAATPGRTIALVGDSFTFGTGVAYDETFGSVLADRLPGVEVYNFAMPAFGVDQMWSSVRHHALDYDPELIIVGLVDADFKRSLTAFRDRPEERTKPLFKLVDGELVEQTAADRPPAAIHFLEHRSRLWTLGRLAARWLGYRIPLGDWWHVNRAILDAIRRDAGETPVLFVYIPTVAWRPFPTLVNHMRATGAYFLDLRTVLDAPNGLYFPVDGHLNRDGHAAVGAALHRWIEANLPELTRPIDSS